MSKERAAKIANSPRHLNTAARNRIRIRQEQSGRHHRAAQGGRPKGGKAAAKKR